METNHPKQEVLWPKSSTTFLWFSRLVLTVFGLGTLLTIASGDVHVEKGLDLKVLFNEAEFSQMVLAFGIFLLLSTPFIRNFAILLDVKSKKERAKSTSIAVVFSCLMILVAWAFIYLESK